MFESRRDFPTASASNVTLPQQKRKVEFSLVHCDVAVFPTFPHDRPPHPLLSPVALAAYHTYILWLRASRWLCFSGPHWWFRCGRVVRGSPSSSKPGFFFSTSDHSISLSARSKRRLASLGYSGGLDAAGATRGPQLPQVPAGYVDDKTPPPLDKIHTLYLALGQPS